MNAAMVFLRQVGYLSDRQALGSTVGSSLHDMVTLSCSSFSITTLDVVEHDFAVGTHILSGPGELDMQDISTPHLRE